MMASPRPNEGNGDSPKLNQANGTTATSRPSSDFLIAQILVDQRYPHFNEQEREPLNGRIFAHLDFLRATYPDINDVRGKRILDLACGSTSYEDNSQGKYDPWMSRLLLHLKAIPVGIDICPQHEEGFEWHRADLTIPNALHFLETESFDAVYVCSFPTRKAVTRLLGQGLAWRPIQDNISQHLIRSLKPGGKVIRTFNASDDRLVQTAVAEVEYRSRPHFFDDYEL